jgi:SAM-dependent methyltransferase
MDNIALYEKFDWEALKAEDLHEKATLIHSLIPENVKTILDVGCGNGAITNFLADYYTVTGLDRSESALEYVNTNKILASADAIPIKDNVFDLVFSSELLEHLEDEVLVNTVKEIKRVSKSYILISVPNAENPDKLSIQCPECKYIFNRPNHLRSFSIASLTRLFPEYELITSEVSGKKVRYYNPGLLRLKVRFTPPKSWIPYFWIPEAKRQTFCPSCENEFTYPYKSNVFASFLDLVNVVVSPKKPYWLIVLFKIKEA